MSVKWFCLLMVLSLAMLSYVPNAAAQDYPEGMVSYWKFEEAGGTTAGDSVGNNPGTLIDGPVWTTGQVAGVLYFDGVNDYVVTSLNSTLTGNPSFTIEAWVYVPTGAIIAGSYPPVLWWGVGATMREVFFGLAATSINRFYVGFHGGGQMMSGTFTNDQWHHFAWVRTGGGAANSGNVLYVDGQSVALQNSGMSNDAGTPNIQASPYCIQGAEGGRHFRGKIDEVAIYSRALTPEEIQQHYQNGLQGLGYIIGEVEPPIADAGPDLEAYAGEEVTLDGSNSYDPVGEVISWIWRSLSDIENPIVAEGEVAVIKAHGYAEELIELTVRNNYGAAAKDTMIITNPGTQGLQGEPGMTPEEVAAMQLQIQELQQEISENRELLERLPQLEKGLKKK